MLGLPGLIVAEEIVTLGLTSSYLQTSCFSHSNFATLAGKILQMEPLWYTREWSKNMFISSW